MREMKASFLEPENICHLGTDYIVANHDRLVEYIKKLGIIDKAEDMLHDCYICMIKKENDGEGFKLDEEDYTSNSGVDTYVYNTLKKYARNKKYQTDIMQFKRKKGKIVGAIFCGSCSEDTESDQDSGSKLDAFQTAYKEAPYYEDYETIEDLAALREQIDYIINFEVSDTCNIRVILEKLDEICSMKFDKDLFSGLCKLLTYHEELRENFESVLKFRQSHREEFDSILASM